MQAKSPDGSLTARDFEINGGATTDFAYNVDVSRDWPINWNHTVASFYGAGRSYCAYGLNLRWLGNNKLLITYKDAKSADVEATPSLFGRRIAVVVNPGINDPSAPCGGMEYGQGGKLAVIRAGGS